MKKTVKVFDCAATIVKDVKCGVLPTTKAGGKVITMAIWLKYSAYCVAWVVFAAFGMVAVPAYWITLRYWVPKILSGRFLAKYDWSAVTAGGAFDQSGLTKLMILILAMEIFVLLGRNLAVRLSSRSTWRICVNTVFLLALVMPFVMSLFCAWELARYIAVMGVTPDRISAARYLILFISTPVFLVIRWHIGCIAIKKYAALMIACIAAACCMCFTVDAIARRSVALHPRPEMCWPNRVGVPSEPETFTDYGLKEVVFGVSAKR